MLTTVEILRNLTNVKLGLYIDEFLNGHLVCYILGKVFGEKYK